MAKRKEDEKLMEKSEQREIILQIKEKINSYEGPDDDGVVKGLMWSMYLIEHGKEYADNRVKLEKFKDPKDCGC
jgi:hypothetical protein